MNILSNMYCLALRSMSFLAADAPAPKKEDKSAWKLFGEDGIIGPIQMVLIALLIGLLVFWFIYKKKQKENQ